MREITTQNAPPAGGHYSQAIVHGDTVYVSGQLPIDPETGEKVLDSIEAQTLQALKNMAAILEAAGSGAHRVLKTTIYISDVALWAQVNDAYAAFFGEHRPARAIVPSRDLHYGFQVEIEAIAAL